MPSQSRLSSLLEVAANVGSGMLLAWLAGLVIYPLLGAQMDAATIGASTVIFTVISVVRSYAWRRFFNHQLLRRQDETV